MRAWLVTVLMTVGCLHAQGPRAETKKDDPAALQAFERLLGDAETIDDAAAFAKAKGLSRGAVLGRAERAYWAFMKAHRYAPAAEIAWRFRADPKYVGMALDFARKDAMKRVALWQKGMGTPSVFGLRYQAEQALAAEAIIACRYSAVPEAARMAVDDAYLFRGLSLQDDVLFPLLDAGCPVGEPRRSAIIDAAVGTRRLDDYAIRHAAASNWNDARRSAFLWQFFSYHRCSAGFRAVAALRANPDDVVTLIENGDCEYETLVSDGWSLSAADAGRYFFAAVRKQKYNLALELLESAGFGEDGETYLFQEALRGGHGGKLVEVLRRHMTHHDAFMAYAYGQDRYRFVANYALTYAWQKKAFDKLIELGKWEDAAEAAQYGFSDSLRTEGILIAFRAAMAAHDFKAGRYFVARYGPVKDKPGLVTQEMYEAEKDAWYAKRQAEKAPAEEPAPAVKPKKKKKRKRPKPDDCPPGDWCP